MSSASRVIEAVRGRLSELTEVLMLHPGTAQVIQTLVVFRFLVLGVSCIFLLALPLLEQLPRVFFNTMLLLALVVFSVTIGLSLARRLRSERLVRLVIVGSFCSDLLVEIVALMASGLSHSTIVVLPLISLMSAAVFVGVRASLFCSLFFAVCYPLGALLVSSGVMPVHSSLQWTGLGQQVPRDQLVSFTIAQELFFTLALVPFWALVRKMRALYRNFAERLEQAVGQAESEVHARASERRQLEQRLQQAEKLESLGLLAGGVAHDFNNIMVGIMGHAELMAMRLGPESEHHRPLSRIIEATRRAAGLCKQMLTYSGQGTINLAPVDLNALVQELPNLLGAVISSRTRLELQLDATLPLVDADASQLNQVAMNLIINASEALGEQGGRVVVQTGVFTPGPGAPDSAGWQQISWRADGSAGPHAYLAVLDDGCGMDRETLDKIFDPFFSTKFAGRGLGLSAVMGIVHSHHGLISIASQRHAGSRVRVAFPLSRRRQVLRRPTPRLASSWRGSGTALLVDDDPDVLLVVQDMLVTMGFSVLVAQDGERAIELLRQHSGEIRFIVCDIAMPGMDGAAVLATARAIIPDIPFVLASGFAEADMRRRFVDHQVDSFLQKPFSYLQLQEAAYQLLHSAGAAPRAAAEQPPDRGAAAANSPAAPDLQRSKPEA